MTGKKKVIKQPEGSKPPAGSTTLPPAINFACRELKDTEVQASPFDETGSAEPPNGKVSKRKLTLFSDERLKEVFRTKGYEIKKLIGQGGMASVFEAESGRPGIPKRVAIKLLQLDDERTRSRFFDEANLIRRIDHQNVIKIFESAEIEGMPYLVMEYLDGKPLSSVIHDNEGNNAIPVERALRMALQICDGLHQAHEQGIIHRDLKPDNIFVLERGPNEKQDIIKILDFGIARIVNLDFQDAPRFTQAGSVLGTPDYISPEALQDTVEKGKEGSVDVYSLGVTLYEMITGSRPFVAGRTVALLYMHLKNKPIALRKKRPDLDIPEEVEALVLKAMAKDPKKRFQSMDEMKQEIEACLDPTKRLPKWQRTIQKYGLYAALGIAVAAAAVHFKDEIKGVFVGDKTEIVENQEFYTAKINADIKGVEVWEEKTQKDGSIVDEKIGITPLSKLFFGRRRIYLSKEGYKRTSVFEINSENKTIDYKMEQR